MPYFGYEKVGHGIFTAAVDPISDDVLICVAGKVAPGLGGIYRSTDGGDSWEWYGNGLPEVPAFYRPEEFWYGGPAGWPSQLVFSTDGSALTFSPVEDQAFYLDRSADQWLPVKISCGRGRFVCAADPFSPGRFLVAGEQGIDEVTEGGRVVSRKLPQSERLGFSVAFDAHTRGLVVATTADGTEIWLSQDGGENWQTVPDGMNVPTGTVAMLVVDRERLFIITRGSGVWTRSLSSLIDK